MVVIDAEQEVRMTAIELVRLEMNGREGRIIHTNGYVSPALHSKKMARREAGKLLHQGDINRYWFEKLESQINESALYEHPINDSEEKTMFDFLSVSRMTWPSGDPHRAAKH